jgi:hypothetical protein
MSDIVLLPTDLNGSTPQKISLLAFRAHTGLNHRQLSRLVEEANLQTEKVGTWRLLDFQQAMAAFDAQYETVAVTKAVSK